jgi:dihydropteroate synthase
MRTKVIGILNTTPDSFSDGGLYYDDVNSAVAHAKQLVFEGADIIDIGGESTRPGSENVTVEEEVQRVIPVIKAVRKALPKVKLSIDTWKHDVAKEALDAGVTVINSLGGFSLDTKLVDVAAHYKCPVIMYHIKGTPKTMQHGEIAYTDIVKELTTFFNEQITFGEKNGVFKEQCIIDPGIGFGKTIEQNIELLKRLKEFSKVGLPIAIGVSRKSHIGTILQKDLLLEKAPKPTERLEGSLAETAVAVMNGASIIRTHDVLQTKKFLAILERIMY